MTELVRYLVESLVDNVDEVYVTEIEEGESYVIEVRVSSDDMGKIIGKNGRIAKAIRMIVKAASSKSPKPYFVKIV